MGFTVGITGCGLMAENMLGLFKAHPAIDEVVVADLVPERRESFAETFELDRTFESHAALCESDVDAIAIFAQRHLHGELTTEALEAEKHVYCAVPMASSIEDIEAIIDLVERKNLVYMTGETSYYYPHSIYCRRRFRDGDFGDFVYAQGGYYHDMSQGFYEAFQHSGGEDWKQVAGFPPMFYPTHSVSSVLSVTGARATQVSCFGYRDDHPDGIFREGGNLWDNPFSNQTALLQTSDGGMVRINEFRRVGYNGRASNEPVSIYGTEASFEENSGGQFWTSHDDRFDLSDRLDTSIDEDTTYPDSDLPEHLQDDFRSEFSTVHPVERLPEALQAMGEGHNGSHPFLVDDFAKAVDSQTLPPINAWESAKYCAPGLIAHESCTNDGETLEIPDFGTPPEDWDRLDPAGA